MTTSSMLHHQRSSTAKQVDVHQGPDSQRATCIFYIEEIQIYDLDLTNVLDGLYLKD